jgi:hypothetical protein
MTVIRSVAEREVMTPIQIVSSDEASTILLEHDLKTETEIRSSVLKKDFMNEDTRGNTVEMDTSTDFTPFPTEDADDTFSCVEIIDQGLDMKTTLSGHSGFEKQALENQKDIWTSSKDDNAVVSIGDGGIVPRAPPSIMRQSTFDYGSVVTSKSRMAGLKTKHSSKLMQEVYLAVGRVTNELCPLDRWGSHILGDYYRIYSGPLTVQKRVPARAAVPASHNQPALAAALETWRTIICGSQTSIVDNIWFFFSIIARNPNHPVSQQLLQDYRFETEAVCVIVGSI